MYYGMAQRKRREADGDIEPYTLRLKSETIAEIKRRAEADRRPASQWLRNLIEDALQAKKVVIK
jgi:hypothetical protein